jgi:hypothetical protein
MLMPARVVAAFTEEQSRLVEANASGIEFRNSVSERVAPFWTNAE